MELIIDVAQCLAYSVLGPFVEPGVREVRSIALVAVAVLTIIFVGCERGPDIGPGVAGGQSVAGVSDADSPASKWLTWDGASRIQAIREVSAAVVEERHRIAKEKIGLRADLPVPDEDEIARQLAVDVDAFLDRNRALIDQWSIAELINGTARFYGWEGENR